MWYVYVMRSLRDKKLYIGKTSDLKTRFKVHNAGGSLATRSRRPFELVYYEAFGDKTDYGREEIFLKSGIGRESLHHRLGHTLHNGF